MNELSTRPRGRPAHVLVGIVVLVAALSGCGDDAAGRAGASGTSTAADPDGAAPTKTPVAPPTTSTESRPEAGGIPPSGGACALTVQTASVILGEPAEDEGWLPPHCVFSPVSVPGYGLAEYVSVGEETFDHSVAEWRAARQADGSECAITVERPDLGSGAYEEYCPVPDSVGGGQRGMLHLPSGQGLWILSVELHEQRVTSESAAAELLHGALTVLQGG
jgi:hypothetical protein